MKLVLLLCFLCSLVLVGCNDESVKPDSTMMDSPVMPAIMTVTLPDGQIITGKKTTYANGSFYVGAMKNNKADGKGAFYAKNTVGVGQFKEDMFIGLHKWFNNINGLVSYAIYENGKVLKSYGELDALLAAGDFDEAYKVRGNKAFMGLKLKIDKNAPGVMVGGIIYNSPGDIAGFKTDDHFWTINGEMVGAGNIEMILQKIISLPFDKKVRVVVLRDNKQLAIEFVPAIIPGNYKGVESTRSLLWKSVKKKNTTTAYQKYLDTVSDKTYHAEARVILKSIKANEMAELNRQKPRGIVGLAAFCKKYPDSVLLAKELPAMYKKIENKNSFIKQYSIIENECPTAKKYQPAYYELLDVGPDGMKVRDALTLTNNGTGAELIATKIKYSNKEYRDFKFDELSYLSGFGLPDVVVSAMLESTYKKEQKTADEYKKRAELLAAENLRMKAQATAQQQTVASQSQAVDSKSMPVECLKLVAALKACDQASGLLSFGCNAVARSSFDCPLPIDKLLH